MHATERSLVLDFDGTVTLDDMLDRIAAGFGDEAVYREVEEGLLGGEITLRECIEREFEPVTAPLEEVVGWTLEHARIRPGFAELVERARADDWRVLVVSSGFHELIEPLLEREGVTVDEVRANRLDARPEGWRVRWRDEAICDECGQACKRAAVPDGHVVYVGDGYSDRCAALAADRVFATKGLARWLDEHGVPYEPFADFGDVRLGDPAEPGPRASSS